MAFTKAGRYDEVLLQSRGANGAVKAVTDADVYVFEEDGTTAATLYADSDKTGGAEADHIVSPDSNGNLEFFANPGQYVLKIYVDGVLERTDTVVVHPDPDEVEELGGQSFDVKRYGAVGDGSTDDTSAIQAAIDAATAVSTNAYANGAVVFFPPGDYRVTTLTINANDITLRGSGRLSTVISSASGDVFQLGTTGSCSGSLRFEKFSVHSRSGGGHCFDLQNACSGAYWYDLLFNQDNTAKSAIKKTTALDLNGAIVEKCRFETQPNATVPVLDLRENLVSNCVFRDLDVLYTGDYFLWIEPSSGSAYCWNNIVENILFEIPTGGCIKMMGCFGGRVTNMAVFDLQIVGPALKDLFRFGQASVASGTRTGNVFIDNLIRAGGSLDTGIYDLNMSGASACTIGRVASSGTISVELGSATGLVVLGSVGTPANDHGAVHIQGSESDAKAASIYFGKDASSVNLYRDDTTGQKGLVIAPSEADQRGLQIRLPAGTAEPIRYEENGSLRFRVDNDGRIYSYVDSSQSIVLVRGVGGNLGIAISSQSGTGIQFANPANGVVDTNLYRAAASQLATDDQFNAGGIVIARNGLADRVVIGGRGPGGEAAIEFGNGADTVLYRSAADTLRTPDSLTVDGTLLVADGAEATPGVAFASDPDLGLYRIAGDDLGISVGGSKIADFFNDAATLKIGFFGAAPVAKPAATDDLKDGLVALGLFTDGGASPLDLDGGALTASTVETSGKVFVNQATGAVMSTLDGAGTERNIIERAGAVVYFGTNAGLSTTIRVSGNSNAVAITGSGMTLGTGVDLIVGDANDIQIGTTTGTKIGTGATQKIGFYGATPVVQQTAPAVLTNSMVDATTDGTMETMTGLDTVSQNALSRNLSELVEDITEIRTALVNLGLMA